MKHYIISRNVNSSPEKAWEIVGNPVTYHEFAPNIGAIEMLSETERRCYNKDQSVYWHEQMISFEDGKMYSMQVDPQSSKHVNGKSANYPLKSMRGTWTVKPNDKNKEKCEISMEFHYEMKWGILGSIAHFIMRIPSQFEQICNEIMDNYEERLIPKAGTVELSDS